MNPHCMTVTCPLANISDHCFRDSHQRDHHGVNGEPISGQHKWHGCHNTGTQYQGEAKQHPNYKLGGSSFTFNSGRSA